MPNYSAEPLVPARFLFRFSAPVRYRKPLWKTAAGAELDESYRLLSLEELEGGRPLADVRMAWSEEGLAFRVTVEGKRRPPACDENRLAESDGLHVWIDTRDTQNIHRASRFCHRFAFLPAGGGRSRRDPTADQLLINRARENANPVRPKDLQAIAHARVDGYQLDALLPADALTGYDPDDHPRLGFTYAIRDAELGVQTFSVGGSLPYDEDPSLWSTLELVKD